MKGKVVLAVLAIAFVLVGLVPLLKDYPEPVGCDSDVEAQRQKYQRKVLCVVSIAIGVVILCYLAWKLTAGRRHRTLAGSMPINDLSMYRLRRSQVRRERPVLRSSSSSNSARDERPFVSDADLVVASPDSRIADLEATIIEKDDELEDCKTGCATVFKKLVDDVIETSLGAGVEVFNDDAETDNESGSGSGVDYDADTDTEA